jgi:acetyl-CoA C-acetyltransferase
VHRDDPGDRGRALGLRPLARLVSWAVAGVEPSAWGSARCRRRAALERAGLDGDIDLIELNEAFAAQVLAVTAEWGIARTTSG